MTREEKIKDLLRRIEESNKPKSRRRVSRKALEKRSFENATTKIKALKVEYPERVYEIAYVDVVEHERQTEGGIVDVCAHTRAMVVRIK